MNRLNNSTKKFDIILLTFILLFGLGGVVYDDVKEQDVIKPQRMESWTVVCSANTPNTFSYTNERGRIQFTEIYTTEDIAWAAVTLAHEKYEQQFETNWRKCPN